MEETLVPLSKTPDSSNRNAEKPYGSKFLDDSSNPFDNDLPTPGIDEFIENNPQDTENIPVNTESFPGNLGNNPLENEMPPSSTNEDIENNYQGTGNIPVNTENVPDNPGSTPLENDVPTTSTDQSIENSPQTTGISPRNTENYPENSQNYPDIPGNTSQSMEHGTEIENFPSQNPNAEKPYGSKVLDDCSNPFDNDLPTPGIDENIEKSPQEWEKVAKEGEVPNVSSAEYNEDMGYNEAEYNEDMEHNEKIIKELMNTPNFQEDCLKFLGKFLNEKVLHDERLMEEYENLTDNTPQCQPTLPSSEISENVPVECEEESPIESPMDVAEDSQEESPQEMLDPHFGVQNYVLKDQEGNNALHTIKINQLVKLQLTTSMMENQSFLVAIYHSHPEFVDKTISGVSKELVKDTPPPNQTPFSIHNDIVHYRDLSIPCMKMNLKGALVNLRNAKSLFMKLLLNSTDQNNHGHLKDAKEWHLMILPCSKTKAQSIIQNSQQPTELTQEECIPVSFLRIQVKTEVRKNQKLQKPHRGVEIDWPFYQRNKRKRLEREYFQSKMRKIARLTDEELQEEI